MSTDPTSHPVSKPPASPPFADNVVRPFTSQGGTFRGSLEPLAHARASTPQPRASSSSPSYDHNGHDGHPRLSTASGGRDSPVDPRPGANKIGPYMSASARTSYTRVDVDSLPSPAYPPLPPLPAAFFAVHGIPIGVVDADPNADTTAFPTTPVATAQDETDDAQPPVAEPPIPQTPQVSLTFLLVSGHRKTQSFAPETTVGRVKELVWSAWPARDAGWQDERPPAPSYLRILYLGKILQDDDTLLRVGFPTCLSSTPNISPTIVHLSVRPYALPSDDPALSKKKRLSVAISRRLSSAGVAVGVGVGVGGGRNVESDGEGERRMGCCTGCTIC